jgi:Pro-kumamolisin, activation domain
MLSAQSKEVFNPQCFSLRILIVGFSIVSCVLPSSGQTRVKDRIGQKIDNSSTLVVRGNVHPLTNARNDEGAIAGTFRMEHVTMLFRRTKGQQAELNALLEQQQDPTSPNYHRWLSPEEFADRFGLSENA